MAVRRKGKGSCKRRMWRRKKCKSGLFLYPGSPQKGPQHQNLRQQKYQQLRQSVKVLMESIRPTLCDFPPSLRNGGRHISEITEVTILPSPSCRRMSTSNPALLQPPTVPVVSWREGCSKSPQPLYIRNIKPKLSAKHVFTVRE